MGDGILEFDRRAREELTAFSFVLLFDLFHHLFALVADLTVLQPRLSPILLLHLILVLFLMLMLHALYAVSWLLLLLFHLDAEFSDFHVLKAVIIRQ